MNVPCVQQRFLSFRVNDFSRLGLAVKMSTNTKIVIVRNSVSVSIEEGTSAATVLQQTAACKNNILRPLQN